MTDTGRNVRAKVWYALVITLIVQAVLGGVIALALLRHGESVANKAAASAARSQVQVICPLMRFFLDYYNQLDRSGKLSDPGKTARDQMQEYTDKIGCPSI